jgi:hypothetical protein
MSTGVDAAGGACSMLSGFVDACQLPGAKIERPDLPRSSR